MHFTGVHHIQPNGPYYIEITKALPLHALTIAQYSPFAPPYLHDTKKEGSSVVSKMAVNVYVEHHVCPYECFVARERAESFRAPSNTLLLVACAPI